jgi:hypothetical protein
VVAGDDDMALVQMPFNVAVLGTDYDMAVRRRQVAIDLSRSYIYKKSICIYVSVYIYMYICIYMCICGDIGIICACVMVSVSVSEW